MTVGKSLVLATLKMKSYTKIVASGATAILLVVALFVIFSKNKNNAPRQKPGVNDDNLDPDRNYGTIATNLFNAFDGLDWFGMGNAEKVAAINDHLNTNQDEFKEVYNIYNDLYAKGTETLRTHFLAETLSDQATYTAYVLRFSQLQLS